MEYIKLYYSSILFKPNEDEDDQDTQLKVF